MMAYFRKMNGKLVGVNNAPMTHILATGITSENEWVKLEHLWKRFHPEVVIFSSEETGFGPVLEELRARYER